MNNDNYILGKGLESNIPKKYDDIMKKVTKSYQSKKISIKELAQFAEKCDHFLQSSSNNDLYNSDLIFEMFKEQTGYNSLLKKIK